MIYEAKFSIGDLVFVIHANKVRVGTVHSLTFTNGGCKYQVYLHGDENHKLSTFFETHLIGDKDEFIREVVAQVEALMAEEEECKTFKVEF